MIIVVILDNGSIVDCRIYRELLNSCLNIKFGDDTGNLPPYRDTSIYQKASIPRPSKRGGQGGSNSVGFAFITVKVANISVVEVAERLS